MRLHPHRRGGLQVSPGRRPCRYLLLRLLASARAHGARAPTTTRAPRRGCAQTRAAELVLLLHPVACCSRAADSLAVAGRPTWRGARQPTIMINARNTCILHSRPTRPVGISVLAHEPKHEGGFRGAAWCRSRAAVVRQTACSDACLHRRGYWEFEEATHVRDASSRGPSQGKIGTEPSTSALF